SSRGRLLHTAAPSGGRRKAWWPSSAERISRAAAREGGEPAVSPYLLVVLQLVVVLAQAGAKSKVNPAVAVPQVAESHAQPELAAALGASLLHRIFPGVTWRRPRDTIRCRPGSPRPDSFSDSGSEGECSWG